MVLLTLDTAPSLNQNVFVFQCRHLLCLVSNQQEIFLDERDI